MRFFLVRHGQTEANVRGVFCGNSDIALTAAGEAQANQLAAWLTPVTFTAACCSALQRARTTAQCILGSRQVALQQQPALNEMHFGAWEMRHYREVQQDDGAAWQTWVDDWQHARPTGGESFAEFNQRVASVSQAMLSQETAGEQLLVSHQGVLSLLLAMPPQAMWHFPFQHDAYTVVDIQSGQVTLRAFNQRAHWLAGG